MSPLAGKADPTMRDLGLCECQGGFSRQRPALGISKPWTGGLEIIGVSYETDRTAMEGFRAAYEVAWPSAFSGRLPDEDPIGWMYRENGAGVFYAIDREGQLIGKYSLISEVVSKVEELLR